MYETTGRWRRPWHRAERHCALLVCVVLAMLTGLPGPLSAGQAAYVTEEVTFTSAGVTLSGSLCRAQRPVAAVVIVHGSGQEARMTEFAALLAAQGITAFTYDKRGVGKSGGV